MPAKKPVVVEVPISVRLQKTNADFRRVRERGMDDVGKGNFLLLIDITAITQDVYIPISVASGKKQTGFIYEIQGTAEGIISTTKISCEGKDATQITLGTIVYGKIPATKTGTFRIQVETRGKIGAEYRVVINRINYKFDPSDARYGKFSEELVGKSIKFR